MTPLEVLTKELGYTKISESETLAIFQRKDNGFEEYLGIGKLIGISYTIDGRQCPIYPYLLAACVNFMIGKEWIDLSKGIDFYMK